MRGCFRVRRSSGRAKSFREGTRSALFIGSLLSVSVGALGQTPARADLAIVDVRLYPGPGEAPVDGANIAVRDGVIVAVGTGLPVEADTVLDGGGRAATAGLWNSHVHFTDPDLRGNEAELIRDMLLRFGFTTVVDTGSELRDTLALSRRIDTAEIPGPRILLANGSFVYTDGTPSYLPGIELPEIVSPEAAEPAVASVLDSGSHGIKIFSGSFQAERATIHLPAEIVQAIADAAHARGSFVMSHPTDRTGLVNAVENGVDVLAHTAPSAGSLGADVIRTMIERKVAVIPTLTLWAFELMRAGVSEQEARAYQERGVAQLAVFHRAGGDVLFGTDVGYMDVFDTAEELVLMERAGMSFDAILASLTTSPSTRFTAEPGRVTVGVPADIVLFTDDPADDVTAFARVHATIRGGRIVFRADVPPQFRRPPRY